MKKIGIVGLLFLLFIGYQHVAVANDNITRGQAFQLAQEAFKAQVELSEKPRSMEEIFERLEPYFADSYKEIFLEENLVYVEGGYQTFGSDFAPYYVPFFHYDDQTKVYADHNKFYVVEETRNEESGPVQYGEGNRGVLFEKMDGSWKITDQVRNLNGEGLTELKGELSNDQGNVTRQEKNIEIESNTQLEDVQGNKTENSNQKDMLVAFSYLTTFSSHFPYGLPVYVMGKTYPLMAAHLESEGLSLVV